MLAVVSLVLAALASPFIFAGRVVDPMGAPLAGAAVTAVCAAAAVPPITTDQKGQFALDLPPGRCTVTIAFEGFVAAVATVDALETGHDSRQFTLQIAGVQEAVSVSAAVHAIDVSTATKTVTPLRDVPQSVTVVPQAMMRDQLMTSIGQVVQYVPGIAAHQGENNRDQIIVRGNSSSADFFVNGVRDDMQ